MTAKEKYDVVWDKICKKMVELNFQNMILSKENSEGWCNGASWYGENNIEESDYLHVTPIEKLGRKVYGTISYSIGEQDCFSTYKTYEKFEKILNDYLSFVKK